MLAAAVPLALGGISDAFVALGVAVIALAIVLAIVDHRATPAPARVAIVRVATEDEALELFRQDVYMRNGIWVEIRALPFGRVRD